MTFVVIVVVACWLVCVCCFSLLVFIGSLASLKELRKVSKLATLYWLLLEFISLCRGD